MAFAQVVWQRIMQRHGDSLASKGNRLLWADSGFALIVARYDIAAPNRVQPARKQRIVLPRKDVRGNSGVAVVSQIAKVDFEVL